jgi:hypothetical protein
MAELTPRLKKLWAIKEGLLGVGRQRSGGKGTGLEQKNWLMRQHQHPGLVPPAQAAPISLLKAITLDQNSLER